MKIDLPNYVRDFQVAMGQEKSSPDLWDTFIKEERVELLKELIDVIWVCLGKWNVAGRPKHYLDKYYADEVYDYACAMFGKLAVDEAFKRVYDSNMSKLGDDGKPIYREDGKVLKGPNYKAPELGDLVDG